MEDEIDIETEISASSLSREGGVCRWEMIGFIDIDGERVRIGYVRLYFAQGADKDILDDCDAITESVYRTMRPLAKDGTFFGNVLIMDRVFIRPEHRQKGYGKLLARAAVEWFEPMAQFLALFVTKKRKFRPAAFKIAEAVRTKKFKGNVYVRDLSFI